MLDEYKIRESDNPDRERIDFAIEDGDDNVAWVWGDTPLDVDWECNHPYPCVEFGDADERGACALCGATCDWHIVPDEMGHGDPEPHEWHTPDQPAGLIGEYLASLTPNPNTNAEEAE